MAIAGLTLYTSVRTMGSVSNILCGVLCIFAAACWSSGGSGTSTSSDGGSETDACDFGFVGSGGYRNFDSGTSSSSDAGGRARDSGPAEDSGRGRENNDSGAVADATTTGVQDGEGPVADGSEDAAVSDGSGVGVVVNTPAGFFVFLQWSISGPGGSYSGRVYFGDASHSLEFVIGGINAGDGYTMTLAGMDPEGQVCTGVSAPFDIVAGRVSGAGVDIVCPPPIELADVGTPSIDASVSVAPN